MSHSGENSPQHKVKLNEVYKGSPNETSGIKPRAAYGTIDTKINANKLNFSTQYPYANNSQGFVQVGKGREGKRFLISNAASHKKLQQ